MTQLHRTLSVLALAALATAGQAATVEVRFDDPIFNGVSAPTYDQVSITFPKKNGKGSVDQSVAAGRFQGTVTSFSGVDEDIFVAGLDDLYMYCYDVYDNIKGGWTVDYKINRQGATARTLEFLGAVNSVLVGTGDDNPYAWLYPSNGNVAAAIQIGIWESLFDSGTWNIASGNFKATGLEDETATALSSFFAATGSADPLEVKFTMTLEANGKQDMITGDPPPAPVPEPGTLALLTVAAVGLVSTRRRAPSPIA